MSKQIVDSVQWQAAQPKKILVSKVIIKSTAGNVLVVKPEYKDVWQLPGGAIDAHEDPIDGLLREIKEEVGLDLSNGKFVVVGTIFKKEEDILFIVYKYSHFIDEKDQLTLENDEDDAIKSYQFVDPSEIGNYLSKYYKNLLTAFN